MTTDPARLFRSVLTAATCVALLACSGCWAAAAQQQIEGKPVMAVYDGMPNHSVAVVVYADDATIWEYTSAREDVAAYVGQELRTDLPSIKLIDYREVAAWQRDTMHWESLSVKDMGRHFSTDRVIYIELLEYTSHEPGSADLLRGRIRANAEVFEVDKPGESPAWHGEIDSFFPMDGPADVSRASDLTVRKQALQYFAKKLVGGFYDHKEHDPTVKERIEGTNP